MSHNMSIDELLAQATCAVWIEGAEKPIGTAWLVSDEGHLITAGHVLGKEQPREKVEVRFTNDEPSLVARRVEWRFERNKGIDFAILQLEKTVISRRPLPILLDQEVSGTFRLYGYGQSLAVLTGSVGEFVGLHDPSGRRLFRLRSQELVDQGFSGGAVYSEQKRAVVAIQVEAGKTIGPTSRTVLAMPLYRIAEEWEYLYHLAGEAEINQIVVYVAVLSMTASEAQELESGEVLTKKDQKKFEHFKSHSRLANFTKQYGTSRNDWRPLITTTGESVRNIIQQMAGVVSDKQHHRLGEKNMKIRYLSDDLFSQDEERKKRAQNLLKRHKGLLIIDAISMYHSELRDSFLGGLIGNMSEVPVVVIPPFKQKVPEPNRLIYKDIYKSKLSGLWDLYSDYDPFYEFDISSVHHLQIGVSQ